MNTTPLECKKILEQHYKTKFQGVVLYGSYASHEETEGSDLDLLVLLKQPFDYFQELRRIVDLLYVIQLESDALISAKPADIEAYRQGELQLYRNILREGITV